MSRWFPAETAPTQTILLTWGRVGHRLLNKGADGLWRNMRGSVRTAPTHWMWLPERPDAPIGKPAKRSSKQLEFMT